MHGQGVKQGFLNYINKSVKHGLSTHLYSSWIFLHPIFLLHLYVPLGWTFKHSQDDFSVILRSLFFLYLCCMTCQLHTQISSQLSKREWDHEWRENTGAHCAQHSTRLTQLQSPKTFPKTAVIWVSKHGKHRQFVWLASLHVETKQCPIWIFNFHPLIIDGGSWNSDSDRFTSSLEG